MSGEIGRDTKRGGTPRLGLLALIVPVVTTAVAKATFAFDEQIGDAEMVFRLHALGGLVLLPLGFLAGLVLSALAVWRRERLWGVSLMVLVMGLLPTLLWLWRMLG